MDEPRANVVARCCCRAGAYADEGWSLQAFQKRVYSLRDFYGRELKGTALENPGWSDIVSGTLGALARLIGKVPQHVPLVRAS